MTNEIEEYRLEYKKYESVFCPFYRDNRWK